MAKGGQFERDYCKDLSLWWTHNRRDDIFWRTSNSGGRATVRRRKKQGTFGQHGDIAATDPLGNILLERITFELKRGYAKDTCQDLLDKNEKMRIKPSKFETWVYKAIQCQFRAGSSYWALVVRRDRKVIFVFMPLDLYRKLFDYTPVPSVRMAFAIHDTPVEIAGVRWDEFKANVTPKMVKALP